MGSSVLKFHRTSQKTELSNDNKIKQKKLILKSRNLYKKGIYYDRPKIKSFKSRVSPHILKAKKLSAMEISIQ